MLVHQEKRTIAAPDSNFCDGSKKDNVAKQTGDLYARIKSN